MTHPRLSTRTLATLTLAGLATFPLIVTALHLIQRGSYDPVTQAVSELALGRAGWLMAIAFPASGLAIAGFGLLIRRTDPGAVAVPVLAAASAACTVLAAVFRADRGAASTMHGQVHQLLGVGSFLTLAAAMFICARRFRRLELWRSFAVPCLVWGVVALVTFALVPTNLLGDAHFGIAQRIFLAVWLSWPITLTIHLRRQITGAASATVARTAAPEPLPASARSGQSDDAQSSRRRPPSFESAVRSLGIEEEP